VPSYSTPAAASIEGYWLGQAAPYTTATVVLGDGTLYAIYSRAGRVEGIMTGSVGAGGNTFSASVIDYNGALLTVTPGTIGGTFSTRGELTGSIAIGSRSYTLSGSYDSSYDTPAKVADFAGAWTGTGGSRDGVATTTLTLLADGTFTGATPYCQASGSVTPVDATKNPLRAVIAFSGAACPLAGRTVTGIAVLSQVGSKQQLLAAGLLPDRSDGFFMLAGR
jgi:hypothetical protein